MKLLLIILTLSSLINSVHAGRLDVVGPKTAIIIEKGSAVKECLTFSLKSSGKISLLGDGKCFSEKELRSLKFKQGVQFAGTVLADAAIATVTFAMGFVGGAAGAVFLSATPLAESAFASAIWLVTPATALGTGAGSVYLATKLRPLNPLAQYADISALNERIITDIDFSVRTDQDVLELAQLLDVVLKN